MADAHSRRTGDTKSFFKRVGTGGPAQFVDKSTGEVVQLSHASVTYMDHFFDLVFVVGLVVLGGKFLDVANDSTFVALFNAYFHWFTLYYNWLLLESLINRFFTLKWIPVLYVLAFVSTLGTTMNIGECTFDHFTEGDVPFGCQGYFVFVAIGRFILVGAWAIVALGTTHGRRYCVYKAISAAVPGALYIALVFLQGSYWAMPVVWTAAIALDVGFNFLSSSPGWRAGWLPRDAHYTEERHGMMLIVAIGDIVLGAGQNIGLPIGKTNPRPPTDTERFFRYNIAIFMTLLAVGIQLLAFVVADTYKMEKNGFGVHALNAGWAKRTAWLALQFVLISSVVLVAAAGKSFVKSLVMPPNLFYVFAMELIIALLALVCSQALHNLHPGVDERKLSRRSRLIVRVVCIVIVGGLTPLATLPAWTGAPEDDHRPFFVLMAWTIVIGVTVIIEWIGRIRVGEKVVRGGGHGHGDHGHHDSHHGAHHGDEHELTERLLDHGHQDSGDSDEHGSHGGHHGKH